MLRICFAQLVAIAGLAGCPVERGEPVPMCIYAGGSTTSQSLIVPVVEVRAGRGAIFECSSDCVQEPQDDCELVIGSQETGRAGEVIVKSVSLIDLEIFSIIVESDGGVLEGSLEDGGVLPEEGRSLVIDTAKYGDEGELSVILRFLDTAPSGARGTVIINSDAQNVAMGEPLSFAVRLADGF